MRGYGKPFVEGQSGNPAGRPRGSRNRSTLALEAIFEGEAEALYPARPSSRRWPATAAR
ncbi:DUF5681 domain-containing protein [Methylobacterium sp. J-070]|uniref:DUF5681 domain-containing protein n=1 Tax=Methylobacterium sp. J-070 TaxID=2836650 RepID=UPI00391C08F3